MVVSAEQICNLLYIYNTSIIIVQKNDKKVKGIRSNLCKMMGKICFGRWGFFHKIRQKRIDYIKGEALI